MKKRVMCVHTELVREGSVLYEGKDGNTGITTTEEAAGFAASFSVSKIRNCSMCAL